MCAKTSSSVGTDGAVVDTYSVHVAALYDCARTKVCRSSVICTVLDDYSRLYSTLHTHVNQLVFSRLIAS